MVQEQGPDYGYEFGSQWNDLKVTYMNGFFQLACTDFGFRICLNLWAYMYKKNAKAKRKKLISKER